MGEIVYDGILLLPVFVAGGAPSLLVVLRYWEYFVTTHSPDARIIFVARVYGRTEANPKPETRIDSTIRERLMRLSPRGIIGTYLPFDHQFGIILKLRHSA